MASCGQSPHLCGERGAPAAPTCRETSRHQPLPAAPGHLLPTEPSPPPSRGAALFLPVPQSGLTSPLMAQTAPNSSRAPLLRAALRGGRAPHPWGFGEAPPKPGQQQAGGSRVVYSPQGTGRGRLGSCLSALTLPLAWPGSKGFTAFFGLIVGVSVESGNVCRLSKVSLCVSPPGSSRPAPQAGPGVPPGCPSRSRPPSHLSLPTRVPVPGTHHP